MLSIYNKDFKTKYGTINSVIEAFVEEERNGLFELSFVMLNTDSLFNYIKEDNIVVANANNTLLSQKFRIYMTRKLMNNRVEVFARHISFDLMYDYIDNISFENQSCEYALNSLFRGSQFSKHYKGYSDIINAQNYSMSMVNVLEAIGGKEGSILDTFGNGAELLRDNENIHVLNKRGYDNSVSIEYKKNLTGFELEEDTTDLVTRILPYARYTPEDGEEVIVKASFVDSPLIANYSHPFVKAIDYTEKFEEGEEVTTSKLITFAQNEYKVNKVDMPKQNFKIEFIPLSKCLGYEPFEDSISLCDTVTIKDTRYNINTQAKVIKTIFNVLKNRYEAIELGEPKTSLGDIVGNNDSTKGEKGDKGDKGDKGEDGSIGDFPNSLPSTPIVTTKVYGFANIEISWTFENKVYYQYEVYASKEADFTPNNFNLVHKGQTSTYMYQAKPNETWYFKVCAVNTYDTRTSFGSAYAITAKIDDLSNYVEEMAIDDALIGQLNLGRGWVGELKGHYIDAKNLSVTDGNGKRTLDIDSFGNVNLDVTKLKISSKNVVTENQLAGGVNMIPNPSAILNIDGWGSGEGCYISRYELSDDLRYSELHLIESYGGGLTMLLIDCSGKTIFIDGGYAGNASHCINYLNNLGVTQIDYYIASHCHSDHIEAASQILNAIPAVNAIYKTLDKTKLPSIEFTWNTDVLYDDMINTFKSKGINMLEASENTYIKLSNQSNLKIYNTNNTNWDNYNNQSLMFLYTYKNNKVFLACDGTNNSDISVLGDIGQVDILQLGHHGDGSEGGSSQALIDELKPRHTYFASAFLATDIEETLETETLKRVSFHGAYSYGHGPNHNNDFMFYITGSGIYTSAKSTYAKSMWYERSLGVWYYFKSNGSLAVDESLVIGGITYRFDSSGICVNPNG